MTICLICRQAQLAPGFTSVTLERGEIKLIIGWVPASVCPNCGEAYVDEMIATRLLQIAERSTGEGEPRVSLEYSVSD